MDDEAILSAYDEDCFGRKIPPGSLFRRRAIARPRGMKTMSRTLLALFAHPDDEAFGTGGTIARYASDGTCVTLVCTTRGEVGEIAEGTGATPETLGEVREGELRCAAETMGISELIFLGYRDSGMVDTPENADPPRLHQCVGRQGDPPVGRHHPPRTAAGRRHFRAERWLRPPGSSRHPPPHGRRVPRSCRSQPIPRTGRGLAPTGSSHGDPTALLPAEAG